MKVSVTDLEEGKKQLQVEVSPEMLQKEMEPFYKKYQRSVQLPGFRKGKVPLEILKKSYYGRLIREEALGEILPKLYQKATKMGRVKPISPADIEQMEYEEGKPLRFAASVEVEPEIEVKDYKGLEVVKHVRQITDEDIEARIQKLREESGVERVVERPAKEGDLVLVDLQKLDKSGVPVVGSKIENQLVKLTPESLPELFDATKGEERKVVLTYPEDHPDANLAGTQERYLAKVKEVRERELPALDDEFAKDVSDCNTMEELREKIRSELVEETEQQAMKEVRRNIIEQLLRKYSFDVPERMVENSLSGLIERMKRVSPGEVDEELIRERARGEAIRQIRSRLILDAIAEAENIQVSDKDVEEKIAEIAQSKKTDPVKLKESIASEDRLEDLREELLRERTLEFLVRNAKITISKVH